MHTANEPVGLNTNVLLLAKANIAIWNIHLTFSSGGPPGVMWGNPHPQPIIAEWRGPLEVWPRGAGTMDSGLVTLLHLHAVTYWSGCLNRSQDNEGYVEKETDQAVLLGLFCSRIFFRKLLPDEAEMRALLRSSVGPAAEQKAKETLWIFISSAMHLLGTFYPGPFKMEIKEMEAINVLLFCPCLICFYELRAPCSIFCEVGWLWCWRRGGGGGGCEEKTVSHSSWGCHCCLVSDREASSVLCWDRWAQPWPHLQYTTTPNDTQTHRCRQTHHDARCQRELLKVSFI